MTKTVAARQSVRLADYKSRLAEAELQAGRLRTLVVRSLSHLQTLEQTAALSRLLEDIYREIPELRS